MKLKEKISLEEVCGKTLKINFEETSEMAKPNSIYINCTTKNSKYYKNGELRLR